MIKKPVISEHEVVQQTIKFFDTVLQTSTDGILITDNAQNIIRVNKTFCKILKKRKKDIIETSILSWLREFDSKAEKSWTKLERIVHKNETCHNFEFQIIKKTGSQYFNVNASILKKISTEEEGIIVSIWHDITIERQNEFKLQKTLKENIAANKLNQKILSTIPSAIIVFLVLSNQLKIISSNDNFRKLFNIKKKNIIGQSFCESIGCMKCGKKGKSKSPQCQLYREINKLEKSKVRNVSFEDSIVTISQERSKTLNFHLSKMLNDENYLLIMEDITKEKLLKQQLIQSEKLVATGRLAASIAHEINNPLQGITSHLDLMKDGLPNNSKKILNYNYVKGNVKKIAEIVNQLLDIYRNTVKAKTIVNVNDQIANALMLIENQRVIQQITIKKNLDKDLPKIYGWANELDQVFLNLFLNALENLETKGILTVSSSFTEKIVKIKIKDNGKGILSKNLKHVFDPFFSTKKDAGVGLGLFICKGLIEHHNGKITVEGNLNSGCCFIITLPRSE